MKGIKMTPSEYTRFLREKANLKIYRQGCSKEAQLHRRIGITSENPYLSILSNGDVQQLALAQQ
jgi:hypothetical protein